MLSQLGAASARRATLGSAHRPPLGSQTPRRRITGRRWPFGRSRRGKSVGFGQKRLTSRSLRADQCNPICKTNPQPPDRPPTDCQPLGRFAVESWPAPHSTMMNSAGDQRRVLLANPFRTRPVGPFFFSSSNLPPTAAVAFLSPSAAATELLPAERRRKFHRR